MITIRTETADDIDAIRAVVVDAFTASEFGHSGEAELVDQLRANCDEVLSLVAVDGELIKGHAIFSPATIQVAAQKINGMGLGPMSVAPEFQRTGIGKALIETGFAKLSEQGCPFVLVLGHPEYYPRFGFEPASQYEVTHGFAGIPQEVFFIKLLSDEKKQSITSGKAFYREEFGTQHTFN